MYKEFYDINSNRYNFKIVLTIDDGHNNTIEHLIFLNMKSIELGSENEDESVLYPGSMDMEFFISNSADDSWINTFILKLVSYDSVVQLYMKEIGVSSFPSEPQFEGIIDKDNINYDVLDRVLEIKSLEPINRLKGIANTEYGSQSRKLGEFIQNMLVGAGCNCVGVWRQGRFDFRINNPDWGEVSESNPSYNILNSYITPGYFTDTQHSNTFPNYAMILKSLCESLFCYGVLNIDRYFYLLNRKRTTETIYQIDWDVMDVEVEFTRKYDGMKMTCPGFEIVYGTYLTSTNNEGINAKKKHDFRNEIVCGPIPNSNPPTLYSILYFVENSVNRWIFYGRRIGESNWAGLWDIVGWDYWSKISIDRIKLKIKVLGADISKWQIVQYYSYSKFPNKVFRCTKIEWNFFEDWTEMVLVEA